MNTERVSPHLTARIAQGYVRHHRLVPDQLPDLIASIHRTLGQLVQPPEPEAIRTPAVTVRRSVHRDYVICLDCGYRGQTLRRHISTRHGLKARVEQFWSLTVYDVNTRALIQNKERRADRSSRMDLVTNADGSVDLYVGPSAPKDLEKNWTPSVPAKAWFAYFRLYAPTEAHFNGKWTLPNFEKVQ